MFVTRSKTNNYSNSNPFTNQRIIHAFVLKLKQASGRDFFFFQTARPQALEKLIQVLFNFCEVTAEGYICLDQCLTGFALIYLDSASPLFTSGRFVPGATYQIASTCLACLIFFLLWFAK